MTVTIHHIRDGKRVNLEAPATSGRWAGKWDFRPKHATQLLAKGNRLLKGSGLILKDWGTETTPADKRFFIETDDGDEWDAVPDLAAFVVNLEAKP